MKRKINDTYSYDDLLAEELKNERFKEIFELESLKTQTINALYKIRRDNNLTQKEMADIVNVPQSNISRLENGKVEPTLEFIQRMASNLGYKVKIEFEKIV